MRLFPQRKRKRSPRIEIIPMVDVMFLLLVFYILSSLALTAQRGIPVQLPQAGSGQPGSAAAQELVVTITPAGEFFLNKEKVDPEKLGEAVTALAGTLPGGLEAVRKGSLTLNADLSVQHRLVVSAMDQLRAVGIENFGIATDPKRPTP